MRPLMLITKVKYVCVYIHGHSIFACSMHAVAAAVAKRKVADVHVDDIGIDS